MRFTIQLSSTVELVRFGHYMWDECVVCCVLGHVGSSEITLRTHSFARIFELRTVSQSPAKLSPRAQADSQQSAVVMAVTWPMNWKKEAACSLLLAP